MHLNLSRRLALSFSLVLLLLLSLTGLALARIDMLDTTLVDIGDTGAQRNQAMRDMERHANSFGTAVRTMAVAGGDQLLPTYQKIGVSLKAYQEAAARAAALSTSEDAAPLLSRANVQAKAAAEILAISRKDAEGRGDAAAAFELRTHITSEWDDWNRRLDGWTQALAALSTWGDQRSQNASTQARAGAASGRHVLEAGAIVALLLSALLGLWITRDIARGLRLAQDATQRMAGHDLSQPIASGRRDEIGGVLDALENMRLRMHALATGVRTSGSSIHSASGEIASGSLDLSERTEHAAAVLQATLDAMQSLAHAVNDTQAAAGEADQLARSASLSAAEGGRTAAEAVASMGAVNQSSRRISEITAIIEGIAFQTNILALNAAVEAARAGEQGRGFAVVATEVRSLSQRSSQAAQEIKVLIEDSLDKVAASSRQVNQAGSATQDLVGAVKQLTEIIGTIARQSVAQRGNIDHARASVDQLDAVSQQNAALAEESAAAAQSLTRHAADLDQLARSYRLDSHTRLLAA